MTVFVDEAPRRGMTVTSMTDAIHDLVHPFTDVIRTDDRKKPYKPVDHEPLLVMLRRAVRSSTGRTASGRTDPSARSIIDITAFELWERIEQSVLMDTRRYLRDRPNPMLGTALIALAAGVDALWNQGQITEEDHQRLIRRAEGWKRGVWEILIPLVEKELGVCPECEIGKIINDDGIMQTALVAYYRHGYEPVAKCRHCGYTWQGEGQLVILGRRIGATMDLDALRDMGVPVT